MGIIKFYHDKKWTLQFLDALYNSIDLFDPVIFLYFLSKISYPYSFLNKEMRGRTVLLLIVRIFVLISNLLSPMRGQK
jgi:hypothetical protein